MTPVALLDLRAVYQNGQVKMTWKFPPNAPETVHIYAVKSHKEQIELDPHTHIAKDLRECNGGYAFRHSSISGCDVKNIEFCAYLASHNETSPNNRLLSGMSDCFVSVVYGSADVSYQIRSKPCAGDLVETKIVLQSSAEIDSGILGYSYNFNGKEIAVEFPGKIKSGITQFPPLCLIKDTNPVVKVVAGNNPDVSINLKKISFWQRFFSNLFRRSR